MKTFFYKRHPVPSKKTSAMPFYLLLKTANSQGNKMTILKRRNGHKKFLSIFLRKNNAKQKVNISSRLGNS